MKPPKKPKPRYHGIDRLVVKWGVLIAVVLALASGANATAVLLCNAKATQGLCATFNDTQAGLTLRGHKTLAIAYTGSATVVGNCIIGNDSARASKQIVSVTGSNQTSYTELDTNCSDIEIDITACTSCSVNAWVGTDN